MRIKNWIFLSYARGDVHKVRDLYEKLYHAGFNPWLDKIHLLPGERWQDTVPKRIRGAKLVLLCLSNHSVNKTGYFWREIRMALDVAQEKPPSEFYLIPVRLEDCDIPDDLRNFHCADLFEEDGWMKLVRVVQLRLKYKRKVSKTEAVRSPQRMAKLVPRKLTPKQPHSRRGASSSPPGINEPKTANNGVVIHENPAMYDVSLDLGSESMAAYYEELRTGKGGMIQLQAHAKALLGVDPEYLREKDGSISPLLPARILLLNDRQPEVLPDSHATLQFIDETGNRQTGYDESVFGYFYTNDTEFIGRALPSPDVLFQPGVQEIIPAVKVKGREGKVRYSPQILLQHLTTQVINNFILRSPELRWVRPEEIHLTLIVPNIYSLSHTQEIKEFVERHTRVAEVSVLYRSDSVAYFALGAETPLDTASTKEFKMRVLNRKNQDELRMVTIDLGRQTTDSSLIQITQPRGSSRRHFILGRTGTSNGYGRLNYVFARYYNEVIQRILKEFSHLIDDPFPFDFMEAQPESAAPQSEAINRLNRLVEQIKSTISESYEVQMSAEEQIKLIDPILDTLFEATNPSWQRESGYKELREKLQRQMILPRRFPDVWTRWREKLIPGSRFFLPNMRAGLLGGELELFVQDSVSGIVQRLADLATARERRSRPRTRVFDMFDKDCTMVLVSGPGSQFKPLRKAIRLEFENWNVPQRNIAFLEGSLIERARCIGALVFHHSGNMVMNPEEIHGVYGFLSVVPITSEDSFRAIDMDSLNRGDSVIVTFHSTGTYWLVYSPRAALSQEDPPRLHDGNTAIVHAFRGNKFEVKYDVLNQQIIVNGSVTSPVATYGDVHGDIYPKLWPEVLRPRRGGPN